MRWLALLLLVGGCDAIFRLDPVPDPADAASDGVVMPVDADPTVDAEPIRIAGCPPSYAQYNTELTSYRFSTLAINWKTAQSLCVEDRGNYEKFTHLAVFDDEFERSHINAAMSGQVYWIGLIDLRVDGALEWVTAEDPTYPPQTAFPNGMINMTPGADCGEMLGNSDLQMVGCDTSLKFVCECDDFPAVPARYED